MKHTLASLLMLATALPALAAEPDANLALVSIPGEQAAPEIERLIAAAPHANHLRILMDENTMSIEPIRL